MKSADTGSSVDTGESRSKKRQPGSSQSTEASQEPGQEATAPQQRTDQEHSTSSEPLGDTNEFENIRHRFEETRRTLQEEAGSLMQTVSGAAQDVSSYVQTQLRERPYATLGAAAGLGFILGGGLSPRALRLLVRTGGRMATNYALREMLKPITQQ